MDSFNSNKEILSEEDNEVDFAQIINLLLHNKLYIFLLTFIGVVSSIIFALVQNRVWQGQFQIVISKPQDPDISKLANSNDLISNFIDAGKNNLATEVEILKSPSVLLPIFNYVKDFKIRNGEKLKNWKYADWSGNSLALNIVKGTNVLNIVYKDTDKEIIPDVLKRISNTYQSFSGRNRQRSISNAIDYLETQISTYKSRSLDSLRAVQSFAIEQDLSVLDGNADIDLEIIDTINIEKIRIGAADAIRRLNVQLEQLKNIGDDENKIMYFGSSIRGLAVQGLPGKLDSIDRELTKLKALKVQLGSLGEDPEKLQYYGGEIPQLSRTDLPKLLDGIETEIAFKRLKFKENDDSIKFLKNKKAELISVYKNKAEKYIEADIQRLEKERPFLIKLLKEKAAAFINSELFSANALLKSSERPKEVLIKYKELLREARRDEETLQNLESDLALVNLEKERSQEPWELITDLTVLDYPIYPNKRQIVLIGSFLSLLFSSIVFFIKNIKYKIIYSSKIIQRYFPSKLIEISIDEGGKYIEEIKLITKGSLFDNKKEKIAILQVGLVNDDFSRKFLKVLKEQIKVKEFLLCRSFFELSKFDALILLSQKGKVSKLDLDNLKNKLSLQEAKIIANIFVDIDQKERSLFLSKISSLSRFFNK